MRAPPNRALLLPWPEPGVMMFANSNTSSTLPFGLYQKLPGAQVQGSRDSLEVVEGNVRFAPLDRSHVGAVKLALVRERLLRVPGSPPQSPDCPPQLGP